MPDKPWGIPDAAAVPVPDAGDDTLRDEMARTLHEADHVGHCTNQPRDCDERRVDALLPRVRERIEAERERAEKLADERWSVVATRNAALNRAEKAEAAVERVRAIAYASDDGSEYDHTHPDGGEPECPACWADGIRAALDGTEATHDR